MELSGVIATCHGGASSATLPETVLVDVSITTSALHRPSLAGM
jgi:hypothetical protein